MIVKIDKNIRFVSGEPFVIEHSNEENCNIQNVWKQYAQTRSLEDCFDGDIILVTDTYMDEESFCFKIGKGKYSELIYAKQTGKIHVSSLFVSSYIITSDNYLGFVMDNGNRINTIGGMADISDFINGKFVPEVCLAREFREELGVEIYDNTLFCNISSKYLKIANENEKKMPLYPMGILYEISTTLTKADLQELFEIRKEKVAEKNIRPVFYAKEEYVQFAKYENKVGYALELFECVLKDNVL